MAIAEKSRSRIHMRNIRYSRVDAKVSEDVWKEEEEAIKNIRTGKTEMETQSTDEFLKELKELENA